MRGGIVACRILNVAKSTFTSLYIGPPTHIIPSAHSGKPAAAIEKSVVKYQIEICREVKEKIILVKHQNQIHSPIG